MNPEGGGLNREETGPAALWLLQEVVVVIVSHIAGLRGHLYVSNQSSIIVIYAIHPDHDN